MLSKTELKQYAKMAADSFSDDPLYTALVKNRLIRKGFLYNFMYLRFYLSNTEDLVIQDSAQRGLCIWRSAANRLSVQKALACPRFFHLLFYTPIILRLESAFSQEDLTVFPANTLLLSPVFVGKKFQGQGIAKRLILEKADELTKAGYTLGLETQNKNNLEIYTKLGFRLVKTEQCKGGKITNYLMIYAADRDK